MSRCSRLSALLLLPALAGGPAFAQDSAGERREGERLRQVRGEIDRLQAEMRTLGSRERSVLGDIERLGQELRLRASEIEALNLELQETESAIALSETRLEAFDRARDEARRYLRFRLREIYKRGPNDLLRRFTDAEATGGEAWRGLRYAAWLSERDARELTHFREASAAQRAESARLGESRAELAQRRGELERTRRSLNGARDRRTRMLDRIRDDQGRRGEALAELERASAALSSVVREVTSGEPVAMDIRRFRGLLDPPAEGPRSAGFGPVVHPRFKTRVPHPGWDLDARQGDPIRAVFDGRVVFASWLRGYGLTLIVDHGAEVLSVYAHASVLIVEPGERVVRGQRVGLVGDTGSLRGPYLYFELRENGRPVDPAQWIRAR